MSFIYYVSKNEKLYSSSTKNTLLVFLTFSHKCDHIHIKNNHCISYHFLILIHSKCPIKIENVIQYSSKIDSSNILEAFRISKTMSML